MADCVSAPEVKRKRREERPESVSVGRSSRLCASSLKPVVRWGLTRHNPRAPHPRKQAKAAKPRRLGRRRKPIPPNFLRISVPPWFSQSERWAFALRRQPALAAIDRVGADGAANDGAQDRPHPMQPDFNGARGQAGSRSNRLITMPLGDERDEIAIFRL